MKKIAFFVQHMLCGGIENALITLTGRLVEKGHGVTVYVMAERGAFLSQLPKGVQLKKIPMPKAVERALPVGGTRVAVCSSLEEHKYGRAFRFLLGHALGKSGFAELNVDFSQIPVLEETYDIAVNYQMHSPFLVRYMADKVRARRKLSWIHNDFATTGYQIQALREYLDCCEGFYAVSGQIVKEFSDIFPEYRDRIHLARNLVPVSRILRRAEEEKAEEYAQVPEGCLKLLTVGRLEEQKGYDLALQVCRKLLDQGDSFRWFVLGEGTQREKLLSQCRKLGLEQVLCFLGIRQNPYPYFKDCDIYIQTSRHEGYVTTVTEAKLFNLPIVCTDVSGAREQLRDEENGEIAAIDADSIAGRVHRLIQEPDRRKRYEEALAGETCTEGEEWLSVFED
ncbi:MAG: glycosyltransferase [Lachnospiraceae bacterium]|nr:glycosyltransferase [Lachnospiraceae bacterium]